ncbi:ABC transporter substrate-binding protein [Sphingomonas sp. BK580]|uniref:ABC transporter substrate-binding protein n=1 Tax=Sphingomonas sp. BK580 TaxID=2586972 RepID=UPI0016081B8D|nr:ABC transporter substrate-binding protein [Sphingomonas sp. BK580]MBB3692175.1 peptide/nickel transport system substrate-binding protein [Sphingomonas sp. BK580]
MRRWEHLLRRLALAASAGLLAACTAGGGDADPRARRGGPNGDFTYPATDYAEQRPGKPGGTLHASVGTDTGTLDLHAISHTNAQWIGRLIFDNLVYLDDKGEPTPWLARSWTVSPDGLTYTFHLRDDVTFSDGSRFDAEAVRLNLEHMRDPRTKSPLAAAYIAPYVAGRVIDPTTFEAHLSRPYAPFLDVLAQSWLAMMSPRQIRLHPEELATRPSGTGPFVVERYERQKGLTLRRRADYHSAPDYLRHRGPAYLERVEIAFVPEAMARYAGLASGETQLVFDAPPQNAAAIRADPRLVFDSRIRTGLPFRALTFNLDRAPWTDVRVRRAVAQAVDRAAITRSVFFGEVLPKTDFLAGTTAYYDPAAAGVLRYDPAAANRLLDAAGWTARDAAGYRLRRGERLGAEVLTWSSPTLTPINVAVQADLRKIGFDLRIVEMPLSQYTERQHTGDYQTLSAGVWHTNTPDALYILHHSGEISSAKRIGQNTAHVRDAALDRLLEHARESSDPAELRRLYGAAQRRLVEIVPGVPLDENHSLVAYARRLNGVIFDTSHNTPVLTGAWLDGEAR